jgi:RNA recognition motif-containing protein
MDKHFLRIYNLPNDISKHDLINLLDDFASIKNVFLAQENDKLCGWAWIEFYNQDELTKIYEKFNNYEWKSHCLRIIK